MATLDLWQQTYCLGQMSGAIGGLVGTADFLKSLLVDKLNKFYKDNAGPMGSWSTVWGPVVFEHDPGLLATADNVMYVAANQDRSALVVCIAGTNALSKYDIDDEDNAVNTTVQWASAFPTLPPYRAPDGLDPYLSSGTALGVNNLLAMQDGGTNRTLGAYLASIAGGSKSTTLIFCGHSLGGALAPTLGLALFNSYGGALKAASWANVYLYPTAGPTPGNGDLATYTTQQFPPVAPQGKPYQCWNQNVWNSLDVVPQAWVTSLLTELPFLYPYPQPPPPWPPQDLKQMIQDAVDSSQAGADTGAGPYTRLANQRLAGTFDPDHPVTDTASYLAQAGYQHTTAYDILLGVANISPGARNQAFYTGVVPSFLRGAPATPPKR